MDTSSEPQIVLYDLASTKNICFSPVVWCIRLMLNYKRIPYRTIFLEFPDIEPTLKEFGLVPSESALTSKHKYTVPSIQHLPTNTYLMGSDTIAQFLESTYPDPPVPLKSELGLEIQAKGRAVVGLLLNLSVMPREIRILSPRAQEFFRRTREAELGHPLEDMLDADKEEKAWAAADEGLRALSELMQTNRAEGPFVLGARPSYADFHTTGALQCARTVDEGVFQRLIKYPGIVGIYEACLPYMEKRD